MEELQNHLIFVDTISKMKSVLENYEPEKVRISYSGGSDSDTIMWLFRYAGFGNIKAVFYDTGLEYEATFRHVDYMKEQGFEIETIKPEKSIPWTVHYYGQPFISKYVSDMLSRLQYNNFDFKNHGNMGFEEAYKIYPHSKSALNWWTNNNRSKRMNISWNRWLKEFIIENNGIPFRPSAHCCYNAKKLPSKQYARANNIELLIMGLRRAEGGKRATAYASCYLQKSAIYPYDVYLPLFWWKNEDKALFDQITNIKHSDCYDVYGMRRTGCPGCPFAKGFEDELDAIAEYEPKLKNAVNNMFKDSYEWTRKFKEFKKEIKGEKDETQH